MFLIFPVLCVVICADPTPANGRTRPSPSSNGWYSLGYNVTFSCNDGFMLFGNMSSNCQANDTWSHQPPVCNPGKVISIRNSTSVQVIVIHGEKKIHCCFHKMIILDIMLDLTMLVDSCNDPTPAFGNSSPSPPSYGRYSVGSNVSFSCQSGFQIAGNSFSICQMNYTWSPKPPICYSSNENLKN